MDVGGDPGRALSAEGLSILREAVFLVLSRWWGLQMVLQNDSKAVAYKLMVMHEECLKGKFQFIERLREANQQKAAVHHVRQVVNDDDDDDDDNDDVSRDVADESDDSSNMVVDVLESELNSNPVNMRVDDPR
ncbi:hypothetical protein SO802_013255 [Lithocarpus litseifolius]|uniref:Uncharacterized protein n=1 Tax=Lithocarpus litseifolius TaxID=425828 RepID=A0AAW2D7U4_9ROSI